MEKHPYASFAISFSIVASLALISFASCITAEFKKTKKKDLKLNGRLCFLPESEAFEFGVAGLVCLVMAQIIGNSIICHSYCSRENRKNHGTKRPLLSTTLLLISWVIFGIAVAMLSGATSLSRRQDYGKGWLEGECYVVKDGIFVASALLVLLTVGSTVASAAIGRSSHVNWPTQIHAQAQTQIRERLIRIHLHQLKIH